MSGEATIKKIVVHNRLYLFTARLSNTEVRVLNSSGDIVDKKTIGDADGVLKFEFDFDGVIGTAAMLQRVSTAKVYLNIAESKSMVSSMNNLCCSIEI